jgi:hypothetical protein
MRGPHAYAKRTQGPPARALYLLLHDDMLGVKGGESQAYMVPLLHVGFLIPPRSEPYNSGTRPKASM